jgi:hypothetical protein
MKKATDLSHFRDIARLFHGEKWNSMKIQEKCTHWAMILIKKDIRWAMIREYLTSRRDSYIWNIYKQFPWLFENISNIRFLCREKKELTIIAPFSLADIYITIVSEPWGGRWVIASVEKPKPESLMGNEDIKSISGYIGQVTDTNDSSKNGMNMSIETHHWIREVLYPFQHKAAYIGEQYKKKWIGMLLYHIHDEIFWVNEREMCKSPELAKLYISMGFIPTWVYPNGRGLPDPENPSTYYTDALIPKIFQKGNPDPTWIQFYRPSDT